MADIDAVMKRLIAWLTEPVDLRTGAAYLVVTMALSVPLSWMLVAVVIWHSK